MQVQASASTSASNEVVKRGLSSRAVRRSWLAIFMLASTTTAAEGNKRSEKRKENQKKKKNYEFLLSPHVAFFLSGFRPNLNLRRQFAIAKAAKVTLQGVQGVRSAR